MHRTDIELTKSIPTYYSQFGEDRILSRIFRDENHGICVEVGANDGVNDSVTYYFEQIGWHCILVEPNPDLCKLIRSNRDATLHECAASDQVGVTTLLVAEGAERAHGVSTICAGEDARDRIASYGFTFRPVQVQTKRLDDILVESGIKRGIDFISIDVEGHEHEALQGFSLERWTPRIIVIEDNSNHSDPRIATYLRKRGYVAFRRTGVNDWYAPVAEKDLVSFANRSRYLLGYAKVRVMGALKKFFRVQRR